MYIYIYRYLSNPYVTDHLVLNRDHRNLLSGRCTSNILDNLGIKKIIPSDTPLRLSLKFGPSCLSRLGY
jgi:hypothetical protein